jgi:hypothetical protein
VKGEEQRRKRREREDVSAQITAAAGAAFVE